MVRRLFGFSWRRMTKLLAGLAVALFLLYLWGPYQIDLIQRRPAHPLPLIPPGQIGLVREESRVMVVTAHPDDEAYYVGGTLMMLKHAGATVQIAVCTNGDKGYYPLVDSAGIAKVRQGELRDACRRYGALDPHFLGFRDGRLRPNAEVVARIAEEIRAFHPTHLLTFDEVYPPRMSHGDHRAAGEAATQAAHQAGFEGWVLHFSTFGPNTFVDVTAHFDEAQQAMAAHASQYAYRIERVRDSAATWASEYGDRYGTALAEQFRAERLSR